MWQVYRSLTFSCARVSFFCTLLAIFPAVTPLLPISAIAAPASPVASADNGAGRRCAPHSQPPARAAPPAWALAPRRALEQLRGLTETERARGERASERASDAGIQRGRDPRGEEGGGGEKGLAAGGSAPPARPLRTRHCLLKGQSGIRILTTQEEGASRAGAGKGEGG